MTAAWTGISTLAEVAASTFTEEGSSTKHVIRAEKIGKSGCRAFRSALLRRRGKAVAADWCCFP
ncbi:hypothetical protein AGATL06_17750 [Agathobaculum sp. TL06]